MKVFQSPIKLIDFDIYLVTQLLFNSLISTIVDYPRDYNVLQTVTLKNQCKSKEEQSPFILNVNMR